MCIVLFNAVGHRCVSQDNIDLTCVCHRVGAVLSSAPMKQWFRCASFCFTQQEGYIHCLWPDQLSICGGRLPRLGVTSYWTSNMVLDTFGEWNTNRPIITDEEMQDPVFIAALQAYIAAVYSKFAGKDDPLDRVTLEVTSLPNQSHQCPRLTTTQKSP